MADYPIPTLLVADEKLRPAANAQVTVYDINDAGNTTPLNLKDMNGNPLLNPIRTTENALTPNIVSPVPKVKFVDPSTGLTVPVTSVDGLEAAAQQAADEANAAKQWVTGITAAATTLTPESTATATIDQAGKITIGVPAGPQGPPGLPGVNAVPADTAVAGYVGDSASSTRGTLDSTYADPLPRNLQRYALPGSGVDRTAALAALFTDAAATLDAQGPRGHDGTRKPAKRLVEIPAGVWNTTAQVVIPDGVSVKMHPGAVIRATAAIAGALVTTTANAWEGQFFDGGTIDCNELADTGLDIRLGRFSEIRGTQVTDFKLKGIRIGDPGLSASSFEMRVTGARPMRRTGLTPPAGSVAVDIDNASDCMFTDVAPVGAQTIFRVKGGNHKFNKCHGWGYPGAFPDVVFDDRGGAYNTYHQCVADSPGVAGWHLESGYSALSGCTVLIHPTQPDNTVVGVRLAAGAIGVRASGCRFQGIDSSHRLAADFKGLGDDSWLKTSTIVGQGTYFSAATVGTNTLPAYGVRGQLAERALYIPGTVTATDIPPQIFWSVPVQADTVVIRAGSGSGTQFQIWQGGTQLTPTFNIGDVATLNSPQGSGTPVKLAAYAGLYIKVVTAGTASNFTAVFKAYQNG